MSAGERNQGEREIEVATTPARERGELAGAAKKRGPAPRPADSRWKHRAERAEALVELPKNVAALLGTPLENEKS